MELFCIYLCSCCIFKIFLSSTGKLEIVLITPLEIGPKLHFLSSKQIKKCSTTAKIILKKLPQLKLIYFEHFFSALNLKHELSVLAIRKSYQ